MEFYKELFSNETNENGYVRIVVPDDNVRKLIAFKKAVKLQPNDIEKFLNSYNGSTILSLSVIVNSIVWMYLFIDVDIKDPDISLTDRIEFGDNLIKNLANVFNGRWEFYIRDGGGIHVFCLDFKIKSNRYRDFVNHLNNTLTIPDNFVIDAPANITLPGCGKIAQSKYVYKHPSNNKFEPYVWCLDENVPTLNLPKNARHAADDHDDDEPLSKQKCFDERDLVLADLKNRAINYISQFSEETALLYVAMKLPPINIDVELYNDTYALLNRLPPIPKNNVQLAAQAEFLQQNCVALAEFHSRNICVSPLFIKYFAEINDNRLTLCELFAKQFPMREVDKKTMQIYGPTGWRTEPIEFIENILIYVSKLYKGKSKISKRFSLVFWNFNTTELSKQITANLIFFTTDGYFICGNSHRLIKASLLFPTASVQNIGISRQELKLIFDNFKNNDYQTFFTECVDRAPEIKEGIVSFETVLGREFYNDPFKMMIYFFITFLEFQPEKIKQYFNLMYDIARGRKKIVMFFIGKSANNGKTTHMRIINNAFGSFIGTFNAKEMSTRHNSGANPDFVANCQKMITMIDEAGGLKIDMNTLKLMTGGGEASARLLYQNNQILQCNTNFCFYGNSEPEFENRDEGIVKRSFRFSTETQFSKDLEFFSFIKTCSPIDKMPIFDFSASFIKEIGHQLFVFNTLMQKFNVSELAYSVSGTHEHFIDIWLEFIDEHITTDEAMYEAVKCYTTAFGGRADMFYAILKITIPKYFYVEQKIWKGIKLKQQL